MCIQRIQIRKMMHSIALTMLLLGFAHPAWAVDGVVLINQARALEGNVTPGDAPGFPVILSRQGSYRLSGNLRVPDADTTAIEMTASNITLDLNGFTIAGPGALGTGTGVDASSRRNITVLNGIVRAMGSTGLSLGFESHIELVSARNNVGLSVSQ